MIGKTRRVRKCATGFASALTRTGVKVTETRMIPPKPHWQSQCQYVCKCVLSERCKSFSSSRAPACSGTELRRREAGWGVPGGERPVRNESELDSAGCLGEPAVQWRSPDRFLRERDANSSPAGGRKPVTLRGRVSKRWRGTPSGWRRNGRKAKHMTQRDLSGFRQGSMEPSPAGVRGTIVATKPGNAGGAKGSRKRDDE